VADDDNDHKDHRDDGYAHLYHNPVDRFNQLPESTRRWLENLRDDDIKEMEEERKFYRTVQTIIKFNKYLGVFIIATFIGAVQFGEAIQKFISWVSHIGRT
jgi:hypothetical protein